MDEHQTGANGNAARRGDIQEVLNARAARKDFAVPEEPAKRLRDTGLPSPVHEIMPARVRSSPVFARVSVFAVRLTFVGLAGFAPQQRWLEAV